jgi:two-component system, chemotaxis family, protein-glutamate methylesterase/glutaminase
MKILLLDPQNVHIKALQEFPCLVENATFITGEEVDNYSSDSYTIDLIIGAGDFSNGSKVTAKLLDWRTHPYTYLVPCWILSDRESFSRNCLWPFLAIDCFRRELEVSAFCEWLMNVTEWQQTRMHMTSYNTLKSHSVLELATSLALRKASGKLSVFDEEGGEGSFSFHAGCLTNASLKHISGVDAFLEFFSWSQGSYCWEPSDSGTADEQAQPLDLLIQEGLRLMRDANVLFHFMQDLQRPIKRTESQSALDDSAAPYFVARKEIYSLIDGKISADQILDASPLSRPRTMGLLAKWFSMGDIAEAIDALQPVEAAVELPCPQVEPTPAVAPDRPIKPFRLLIVDDSHLMCKALQDIFSKDPRFELVGVAHDGIEALSLVEQHQPDVVTLDMQMPRMDGLTTLKHIMIRNPRPVVILSAFTKETSQLTYESFKYGAVDVVTKPAKGKTQQMEMEEQGLRERVADASCVRMEAAQYIRRNKSKHHGPGVAPPAREAAAEFSQSASGVIVIACGAGGFPSLLKLFLAASAAEELPATITCMAMPERVVEALAPNLARDCQREIQVLVPGTTIKAGTHYVYSYEHCYHLLKDADHVRAEQGLQEAAVQRPFDHLFRKVAEGFGDRVLALMISGSGEDGIEGMRVVQRLGGQTFVLSPERCLKPDLPRKILASGYAQEAQSVAEMARLLEDFMKPLHESQMALNLPLLQASEL